MSLLTLGIWIAGVYAAVVAALNFLPTYDQYPLPQELFDAITSIFAYGLAWDSIFPFATIIYCLTIYILFEGTVLSWKGLRWFIAFIRGSGQG